MNAIHLLPLGNADPLAVGDLCAPLERAFGIPVEVRPTDIKLEQFYDERRVQYNSTAIIGCLHERCRAPSGVKGDDSSPTRHVLGVTAQDLFIPILTYVFGEAQLGGPVAVVSYHRLQNERYGLPPDEELLALRLQKEAMHELGHTYGLLHCLSLDCVMHISTYVEDIDMKPASFCPGCSKKLEENTHIQRTTRGKGLP